MTGAKPLFYKATREGLNERIAAASDVDGVADETALMRDRLFEYLDAHLDDIDTLIKCARMIVRCVADEYGMRPKEKATLDETALTTIRELAAMFSKPPEEIDV